MPIQGGVAINFKVALLSQASGEVLRMRMSLRDQQGHSGRSFALTLSALAAVTALLVTGCGGEKAVQPTTTTEAKPAPAQGVSVRELTSLSSSLGQPIFWAGPVKGNTYELSRTKDGRVYIRYLPRGAKVGSAKPSYLAIGTYPQANAYAVLKATAKSQGVGLKTLSGGGLAFVDKTHATSVYLAYPGSAYQIEVYDPSAARALNLVLSGKVVPLGIATAGHSGTRTASLAQLKTLAEQLGHPIYSAGPVAGKTYELTQTTDGRVYIRYLPKGAKVGNKRPDYLTIGTYPQAGAMAALKASAAKSNAQTVKVPGGGFASIDKTHPTSVYLAYPGEDVQIEVYDPSASIPKQLVSKGRIVRVG